MSLQHPIRYSRYTHVAVNVGILDLEWNIKLCHAKSHSSPASTVSAACERGQLEDYMLGVAPFQDASDHHGLLHV